MGGSRVCSECNRAGPDHPRSDAQTALSRARGPHIAVKPSYCTSPMSPSPHAPARQVEAALFLEARLVSQAAHAAELDILRRAA